MVRKKIDNRIRLLIENGVKLGHRTMFAIVGDKGRDQASYLIIFVFLNYYNLVCRLLSCIICCPRQQSKRDRVFCGATKKNLALAGALIFSKPYSQKNNTKMRSKFLLLFYLKSMII